MHLVPGYYQPIQVMPVFYISADYFSLLLLARQDVMDAFTFDP